MTNDPVARVMKYDCCAVDKAYGADDPRGVRQHYRSHEGILVFPCGKYPTVHLRVSRLSCFSFSLE